MRIYCTGVILTVQISFSILFAQGYTPNGTQVDYSIRSEGNIAPSWSSSCSMAEWQGLDILRNLKLEGRQVNTTGILIHGIYIIFATIGAIWSILVWELLRFEDLLLSYLPQTALQVVQNNSLISSCSCSIICKDCSSNLYQILHLCSAGWWSAGIFRYLDR